MTQWRYYHNQNKGNAGSLEGTSWMSSQSNLSRSRRSHSQCAWPRTGTRAQRPSSHTAPLGAWLRGAERRLKPGETQRHCPAPTRTDLAIRFPKTTGNWAQVKITGLNQLLLKQFRIFGEDQNTALCQRLKQIKLFGINHWPGENRLFMVYYTLRGIKISCIIYIYNTGTPEAGAARSLQHPRQVASGIPRHNPIENLGVTKSFLCKRD